MEDKNARKLVIARAHVRREDFSALVRGRAALVASTGGHLEQIVRLRRLLGIDPHPLWITFDTPQARSLLSQEQRIVYVPYVGSRDLRGTARTVVPMAAALRDYKPDVVLSTGAALAGAALPLARVCGSTAVYLESVSRFRGPSMTGRVLAGMPGIHTFTQHSGWANRKWRPGPSLLRTFVATVAPGEKAVRRVFVTLGTIRPWRFDALVDRLLDILPPDCHVVWQLGATTRSDIPGSVYSQLPAREFDEEAQAADVVVSHAGVGSVLRLLELGVAPILVPRSAARGEHVDDHQHQLTAAMRETGCAVTIDSPEDLQWSHFRSAAHTIISTA